MTKKKLLRRPQAPKPGASSKSLLPAVRPPDKGISVHSKFSGDQVLLGQVSSKLHKPHYPLKQQSHVADERLNLDNSLCITNFNNQTTKEEQLVRERNTQILNQRIATLNKGKAATLVPTQQAVSESLLVKKLVDPAGPKPYRSRGAEGFPLRPLKSLPELQKGIILKSWNDAVIIPDYKACDRTAEPTHVPKYFSHQVEENVLVTLETPYELTRPKSLCNLPSTTALERREQVEGNNKDDDHHPVADTEVADYDPGELLDAISDWKPEKSFDEMFQARRRSLLIPVSDRHRPHTAHSHRRRGADHVDRGSNNAEESIESDEGDDSNGSERVLLNPSSSAVSLGPAPVYSHQNVALDLQADEHEIIFTPVHEDRQETQLISSDVTYAEVMGKKHTPSAISVRVEGKGSKTSVESTKNQMATTYNVVAVGHDNNVPRRPRLYEQRKNKDSFDLGKRRASVVGGRDVRRGSLITNIKDAPHPQLVVTNMSFAIKGKKAVGDDDDKAVGDDDDQAVGEISSTNILNLGWLEEKKPRVPKHMIILNLKKLFKNKVKESGISTPEKLFESGVLDKILAEIDQVAERHSITGKERIKAVVGATQEYFDKIQEEEKRLNGLEEMRAARRKNEKAMQLTAAQMEILGSLLEGGEILTLKGHFIYQLPDLSSLRRTLVCLNLSFNNFTTLPDELLLCDQLQYLKLRDNPLKCLPKEIYKLDKLRSLVVSFCKLTELPHGLFLLRHLEFLDVSYNLLTTFSRDVEFLVALTFLSLEGNELIGLPCTMLTLEGIIRVRIRNNFMSPAFWPETCAPEIPKLSDICKHTIQRHYVTPELRQTLSNKVFKMLSSDSVCDCCGKPVYGPGMHVLRHRKEIWGLRQVPFVFQACSSSCHRQFSLSGERSVTDID